MKKFTIASIVVILIIAAASPWVIGQRQKQQYLALINMLNRDYGETIQIKVLSYEEGYLHSSAKYEITSQPKGMPEHPVQIVLKGESDISHGPIVFDPVNKRYTLAIGTAHSRTLFYPSAAPNETSLFTITEDTIFPFTGSIQFAMNIPGITKDGTSWGGLDMLGSFNTSNNQLTASQWNIKSGEINVKQDNLNLLNISPVLFSCDVTYPIHQLPVGNCNMTTAGVSIISPLDKSSVNLKQLSFKHNVTITQNNYSTTNNIQISNIAAPTFTIPDMNALNANIDINNLNVTELMQLGKTKTASPGTINPFSIMTPTTSANVGLQFKSSLGAFNLTGSAKFVEAPNKPITNSQEFANATRATIDVRASAPLANKIAELIVPLIPDYMSSLKQGAASNNTNATTNTSTKEQFSKGIAALVQSGQINLPDAISLMNTHEHASSAAFEASLAAMPISAQAKTSVMAVHKASDQMAYTSTMQMGPRDEAALLISHSLKLGYILQDKNDYTTKITVSDATFKLNDQAVKTEPAPTTVAPALPKTAATLAVPAATLAPAAAKPSFITPAAPEAPTTPPKSAPAAMTPAQMAAPVAPAPSVQPATPAASSATTPAGSAATNTTP